MEKPKHWEKNIHLLRYYNKHSQLMEHYNNLRYTNSLLDGEGLVTEISASLSTKFDGPIQALMRIKQAVEEDIDSFPSYTSMPQCCHATGLTNSSQFRTKVCVIKM
ncbi:uncharacterized protein [Mytilus edulis]|uniref:uncharacterized protein isoform X2 n=1 Tax=Mytilus edulis TaxID=6550 RepID=UPI0039EF7BEE